MYCPKCKTHELQPEKLEQSLPVLSCSNCHGVHLSLLHYRAWKESFDFNTESTHYTLLDTAQDTKTAAHCPKCGKIMTKYHVSGKTDSRIDLCGSCDEVWLDNGEWEALKSLELADKLPKIFTGFWQKRIRAEKNEISRYERLVKNIGQEDAEKAAEFREWLIQNKNKGTILRFLTSE